MTMRRYAHLAEGTGSASPASRELRSTSLQRPAQDAVSAFQELNNPVGGLPGPMSAVSDLKLAFHDVKYGAHAHDRMEERTHFHKSYANQIQMAVDMLRLEGDHYHLPLRHQNGTIAGYAQFKRVPNRAHPVLATILGPQMKPGGQDVEAMMKFSSAMLSGYVPENTLDTKPVEALSRDRSRHALLGAPSPEYAVQQALGSLNAAPLDPGPEDPNGPMSASDSP